MNEHAPQFQWYERWTLLPKRSAYLFTMDLCYEVAVHDEHCQRIRLELSKDPDDAPAHESPLYHVHGDNVVEDADGIVREVPLGKLVAGNDWLNVENGAGTLRGYLVLQSDARDYLTIEYRGRSDVFRRFARLVHAGEHGHWEGAGTAFISTRHECAHPKYSWLVQRQLVGVGGVTIRRPRGSERWRFQFSYDMYAIASPLELEEREREAAVGVHKGG